MPDHSWMEGGTGRRCVGKAVGFEEMSQGRPAQLEVRWLLL